MFATLIGAFPDPGAAASEVERASAVIVELAAAGLEPVSDGRGAREVRTDADVAAVVDAWRSAAAATPLAVKQTLVGPYTLGGARGGRGGVEPMRAAIDALAAAGCPMVEIEEPDAVRIGDDAAGLRLFADGLMALTEGLGDRIHLSLTLTGGNVDTLGTAAIYEPSFSSYAFDLIAGPDNWRLIAAAPRDRGIIVGALGAAAADDDRPEAPRLGGRLRGVARRPRPGPRRARQRVVARRSQLGAREREGPGAGSRRSPGREPLTEGARGRPRPAGDQHPVRGRRALRAEEAGRPPAAESVTEAERLPEAAPAARGSRFWTVSLRVMYAFLRLIDPLIRSWLAHGRGGLDGVVEVRVPGRRSGRPRSALVTILSNGGHWYVGHPNGDVAWTLNAEAAGRLEIDPPAGTGSRLRRRPASGRTGA